MRNGIDEMPRRIDYSFRNSEGPELSGLFKLVVNGNRIGHVHITVLVSVRRIAEFADASITSPGIVPCVRALLSKFVRNLLDLDLQFRTQAFKHRAQIGRHDATTNQNDVCTISSHGLTAHPERPLSPNVTSRRMREMFPMACCRPFIAVLKPCQIRRQPQEF